MPSSYWMNLNKPIGLTSAQALNRLKKILKVKKLGHAGTLDPLASGVLPVAVGEATKLIPYLENVLKSYRFTVAWGTSTTTDDAGGNILAQSDQRPSQEQIEKTLPQFLGTVLQQPPIFSALKVNGQRAYALARKGEKVTLKERPVFIQSFDLIAASTDEATFEVTCGKGTYVRSLARDLAEKLGTKGHVSTLIRTAYGPFMLATSISLASLEEVGYSFADSETPSGFMSLEVVLDDIPALSVIPSQAKALQQGQAIETTMSFPSNTSVIRVHLGNQLIALAAPQGEKLKPVRVFNL